MANYPTLRLVSCANDRPTASRIRYAASAYAALYGFRMVSGPADVTLGYGDVNEPVDVTIPATYRVRAADTPAPSPVWMDGMPCFHPNESGADVLGEVFEWLAAPHELACTDLDEIGRVPPQHTLAGTHGIDRTVPWANRWLGRLHSEVRGRLPRLPRTPPPPLAGRATFVASHDLDHLSGRRITNARRVVKNAAIALAMDRDLREAGRIAGAASSRALRRMPTAVGVADLLAGEAERGLRSTYTVIAESTHRRDAGYRLADPFVRRTLRAIEEGGHELAVHGSYRSLDVPGQLEREFRLLAEAGHPPSGGRQHWLRHRGGELFSALESAGATWDSTLGHPDDIGFRNGAAFPFLPYDFERERPHPIVEIPMVVMERALRKHGDDPEGWSEIAHRTLHAAGDDGWGGVAILWHDYAFTGTSFLPGLADAYWSVLDRGDAWLPAEEVATAARTRWSLAGALCSPDRVPAPVES